MCPAAAPRGGGQGDIRGIAPACLLQVLASRTPAMLCPLFLCPRKCARPSGCPRPPAESWCLALLSACLPARAAVQPPPCAWGWRPWLTSRPVFWGLLDLGLCTCLKAQLSAHGEALSVPALGRVGSTRHLSGLGVGACGLNRDVVSSARRLAALSAHLSVPSAPPWQGPARANWAPPPPRLCCRGQSPATWSEPASCTR